LESQEAYLEYVKWKRTHNIFSQKTEGFHVDYESEGVCNPKASLIFEEALCSRRKGIHVSKVGNHQYFKKCTCRK